MDILISAFILRSGEENTLKPEMMHWIYTRKIQVKIEAYKKVLNEVIATSSMLVIFRPEMKPRRIS